MGKIKSRVLIVLSSIFAVSVAAFLGVTGLTKANAAENLTMKYGASIKCSPGANGLRFTAYVPDYNESENATYGMLIAPADYIENYPLTAENVFGENAVYDWAVKNDDGKWVYSGSKTRIINVSYDSLGTDKDGKYVVSGSILGIKDGNLTRNFVGRAYKKVGDEYTMAEWATASGDTEAKISNSIRCTLEVATAARLSGDSYSDAQAALIEDYEKRSYELAKYASGDDYTLYFEKMTTANDGETKSNGEITDSSALPDGVTKGYKLNVGYSESNHNMFTNVNLDDYVRLKFWIKGKYGLPFAGRSDDPDGMTNWLPVEYVKQANGIWKLYYKDSFVYMGDVTRMDINFSDYTEVSELYGVRDLRNSLRTVTYKDGDEILHVEYVQKGRSAKYAMPSEDLGDGYIEEKEVKWMTENGGLVEANLDSITENITVYASYTTLIYKNHVKPNYSNVMELNKYIQADSNGNVTSKVRLNGNGAAFWIYEKSGGWNANSVGQWAEAEKWYIVKTDAANKKVIICDNNGNELTSAVFSEFDATTMSICAGDNPNTDVAAVNVRFAKKFTVTYIDDDGTVLGTAEVEDGNAAEDFIPATRTTDDGYVIEYSDVLWLDNEAEADFTSITADMTVVYGGGKLVYNNHEKPNYSNVMELNKYVKADSDGNVTFKVRLNGNGAAFWIYEKSGGWNANSVGQWAEAEKWYIVKTDAANKKVIICDNNGNELTSAVFSEFDATTMSICAGDNPNTDIAAVIVKKNYNLNTLVVLNDYNTNVTPKDESGRMYKFAATEFVELYEKLSGKGISVKYVSSESDIVEGENCFYLGSGFASAAGFNCDELTTDTGYSIRKANGNVYLYGKTGFGSLNAVYGFLKQVYGLEFYSDEVYTYNDSSFNYYELTATDFNPSIEYNWASGSLEYMKNDEPNYAYQRRLGFVNPWQMRGGDFHNYFDILPKETYQSAHPNWYTDACEPDSTTTFTTLNLAYGITESDSAMAKAVAEYIYNNVQLEESENRVKPVWIFGQPDVRGWSTSSESAALKEKYGSYSAESILFLKKVAKILDDEYTLGRKLELVTLAYNLTFEAPSKNLDDLKFYNGDEVNMGVMYAPIESNLYRSATDTTIGRSEHSDVGTSGDGAAYLYEKSNAYYFGQLDEWKKLLNGGDILCYYYSAHYDNYFAPLDSITNMQSKYAAFANAGVKHIYNLGQRGDDVSTDWTALKIYLQRKYGENAYRTDGDTLILNFCNAYYGAAGNTMYELYKAYAAAYNEASDYWTNLKNSDPMGCHLIRKYAFDKNAWGGSDTKLLNLYAKIETALGEVEANSEEYKRIQVEGITYRYLLAGVFGNTTKGTIADIATDAKSLGIDIFAEGSPYTATAGASGNHYNTSGKIEDLA